MSLLAQQRKIIIAHLFYLWLYLFFYSKTHIFCLKVGVVRWRQGKERIKRGWKREGGRKQSCRQDYWTAVDVETGNRWERKCAESREQELWQRRVETAGLEPPYDSRWGDEEEWEMGVENLTERELWEKVWIRAEREMESRKRLAAGLIQACWKRRDGVRQGEEKKCCLCHNCWRVSSDDCTII